MTSISKGASLLPPPRREALHRAGQDVRGKPHFPGPVECRGLHPRGLLQPTELWCGRGLRSKPGSAAYLEARRPGSTLLASFT